MLVVVHLKNAEGLSLPVLVEHDFNAGVWSPDGVPENHCVRVVCSKYIIEL